MADARLVIAVVRAPEGDPLAQQIGLLVAVLARTDDKQRVRPAFLANFQQAVGDFLQRLIPGDALILAVHQLHRIAQTVITAPMIAQRGAFGAVCAQVERRFEHRVLPHPHPVFHHGVRGAADRTVRADRAPGHYIFAPDRTRRGRIGRVGLLHQVQLRADQTRSEPQPHPNAGAPQKCTTVDGRQGAVQAALELIDPEGRGVRGLTLGVLAFGTTS